MFCSFLVVVMMAAGVWMFFGVVTVSKEMDAFSQIQNGMDQNEQGDTDG